MTERTRRFRGVEIPSATTTQIHLCGDPHCGHVHLVGFDEDEKPFCELVISQEIADKIQDALEKERGPESKRH